MARSQEHVRLDHAGEDDEDEQDRQARPDFDDALAHEVHLAAEVALQGAHGDADHRADGSEREAEQHREAEAVDEPRKGVLGAVVGAEPVSGGRSGGRCGFDVEVDGVVGVGDRWMHRPAAAFLNEILDVGVGVVGLDGQFAAEVRLGDELEDGEVQLVVQVEHDGLVVGDELGEEGEPEQGQEHPHGVVAAPVGAEVGEAALGERRQRHRLVPSSLPTWCRSRCADRPARR